MLLREGGVLFGGVQVRLEGGDLDGLEMRERGVGHVSIFYLLREERLFISPTSWADCWDSERKWREGGGHIHTAQVSRISS